MDTNLKEKEVLIDIESNEGNSGAHTERVPTSGGKKGNVSLKRLVSGILSFNGCSDGEAEEYTQERRKLLVDRNIHKREEYTQERRKLLVDRNMGGHGNAPLLEKEKEKRKGEKLNKGAKPPRPPKGPTLDAADMRLLKEITRIAKRKQERIKHIKAIKKMKAAKAQSPSASSGATISAMFITGFFFLLIILQGLSSNTSSNVTLAGAPQPAPETTGLTPIEFYKTVMSDDGAAPSFLNSKSTG